MKRSAPITRSKPLRRGRLRRRPTKPRKGKDAAYTRWLHRRPCVLAGNHECWGRIEQSHDRNMTGVGRKEPDANSVPMCSLAHREWEEHRGFFRRWSKELRRQFMGGWIIAENAAYQLEGGTLA